MPLDGGVHGEGARGEAWCRAVLPLGPALSALRACQCLGEGPTRFPGAQPIKGTWGT